MLPTRLLIAPRVVPAIAFPELSGPGSEVDLAGLRPWRSGDSVAGAEGVKPNLQQRRPGRGGGFGEDSLDQGGIVEARAAVKVRDQVAAVC